jgi:hypothetical protein
MSPQSEEPRNQRSQLNQGENRSELGRHLGTDRSLEAGVDGGLYKAESDETINGVQEKRVQKLGERVTARVSEFARDHMPNKLLVGATAVAMTVGFGGNTLASADNKERAAGPSADAEVSRQGKITPWQIRTSTVNVLKRERAPENPQVKHTGVTKHVSEMNIVATAIDKRGDRLKLDGKFPNLNGGGRLDLTDYPRIPATDYQYFVGWGDKPGTIRSTGEYEKTTYKPTLDNIASEVKKASGKPYRSFGQAVKTMAIKTRNGWSKAVTIFAKSESRSIKKVVQNKKGNPVQIIRYK